MKIKRVLLLVSSLVFLCGCTSEETTHGHTHVDNNNDHICDICDKEISEHTDDGTGHCSICGISLNSDTEPANGFTGGVAQDSVHSGYEYTKSNVNRPTSGIGEINIVGFNDFHGAIVENQDGTNTAQAGLARTATFIKKQAMIKNTLVLDQGDTWQGSFESNSNYGKVIQKTLAASGLSVRTVGNHDFDWGIEKLIEAEETGYEGYTVPSLASNVYDYDWDTHTVGTTQQSQIGKEYATFVLDNGIKVGVVGVIGVEQITSISSQNVKNIAFVDHINVIKTLSDYLKTSKACDVVIASVHGTYHECINSGLSDVSPTSGKRYVDLVLNGHGHSSQYYIENGLLFTQWDAYGSSIGGAKLKFDFATGNVIDSVDNDRTFYNAKYLKYYYSDLDSNISSIVTNHLNSISDKANEVLSNKFVGDFGSDGALPNLMCEAIYEVAKKQFPEIKCSVVNYARDSFSGSTFTYGDLYRCFPFDNEIMILEVKGRTALRSIDRNFAKWGNERVTNNNETFKIAVIDYVGLHVNSERYYDYFPDLVECGTIKKNGETYNYREILYDYLVANKTKTFNSDDYLW